MSSENDTSTMILTGGDLHIVFIPFVTSGHMTPLVHAARLFASRGVRSTIITTVHNALSFQASVDRDTTAGHRISVHTLNFPSSEVGLPPGIEIISASTNSEMTNKVYHGIMLLQTPMEQGIRDLAPDCIFSDMFFPWTVDLADELKIPRLLFYPSCFLYHSIWHSLRVYKPHENVQSESESLVIPNLPDEITMKMSQLQKPYETGFDEILERVLQSEKRSYGLVHDTFYELEPAYVDHIKKIKETKVWHIGPLFQFFNFKDRNNSTVSYKHGCLSWLDDQEPKSVIYVCFGSMVQFPEAQITEIALALEESRKPFLWVVGKTGIGGLPEGFEERNKGLIITEWAPQVEILQHPAIGAFLTHCGWNSMLEAVVAGVPLITSPLFAEQFYNEKLVELLGIGVPVGVDVWNFDYVITSPTISKRGIIEAIGILMSDSDVAKSVRQNSKELAMKTKKVVEEGGSSFNDLTSLIEDLKAIKLTSKA